MYFIEMYYNKCFEGKDEWILKIIEADYIEEIEDGYLFDNDDNELSINRGNKVYKDDKDDVISCGYTVLDFIYVNLCYRDECYANCVTFEKEKSIENMKNKLKDVILNQANYYNRMVSALSNVDNV